MSKQSKSDLLNESIVDATELKRAALKNAEQLLLKNYGPTIEEYVNRVLEEGDDKELILGEDLMGGDQQSGQQPPMPGMPGDNSQPGMGSDPMMDIGAETPMGDLGGGMDQMGGEGQDSSPDGQNVNPSESTKNILDQTPLGSEADNTQKITISLGSATQNPKDQGTDPTEQQEIEPPDQSGENDGLTAPVDQGQKGMNMPKLNDEMDINLEEIKRMLEEEVDLDMADSHQGSLFTNKEEAKNTECKNKLKDKILSEEEEESDINLDSEDVTKVATEESDEKEPETITEKAVKIALKESIKYFNQKLVDLNNKNKVLIKENTMYKERMIELKDVLEKSNLLNTRLYYKNQVLADPSLNERQKISIAEAISKADNREKVKTIYEVRQSFLGNNSTKEKTLQQILESKNYLQTFKASEIDNSDQVEKAVVKRMKQLAGIEKDID